MAYDFMTRLQVEAMIHPLREKVEIQGREIAFLNRITPLWLDQAQACKALGISRQTLIKRRDEPGSPIVYRMDGEKGTKPMYCVHSLQAYAASKTIKRHLQLAA